MEGIPPLKLSQDQGKRNHTFKIEANGNYEASSFVHIYQLFLIFLFHIFLFITL